MIYSFTFSSFTDKDVCCPFGSPLDWFKEDDCHLLDPYRLRLSHWTPSLALEPFYCPCSVTLAVWLYETSNSHVLTERVQMTAIDIF